MSPMWIIFLEVAGPTSFCLAMKLHVSTQARQTADVRKNAPRLFIGSHHITYKHLLKLAYLYSDTQ